MLPGFGSSGSEAPAGRPQESAYPRPPLLPWPQGCQVATLLRRHKRFSMEAKLDGRRIWAHSNNSGAMLGLLRPGSPILISPAARPGRKLPFTQEAVWLERGAPQGGGFWVGLNTGAPNRMLAAAFAAGILAWTAGYESLRSEVPCGQSRLDARLDGPGLPALWVECKSVTLCEDGVAAFPDAASERGRRHLRELMALVRGGQRAAMFYLVQRPDCACFAPADYIDEDYALLFYQAQAQGVEMRVMRANVNMGGIGAGPTLRVLPPQPDLQKKLAKSMSRA